MAKGFRPRWRHSTRPSACTRAPTANPPHSHFAAACWPHDEREEDSMTATLITTIVTTTDRRWTGMARHILCSRPTAAAEREAWLAHVLATAYGARPDMDAVPEAARPYATSAILWHCHEEGYRAAAEQGLSFSDNPYDQVDMHTAWSNGWHAACYHAEQVRVARALCADAQWITAFRGGLRAAQEGRPANDCPYQG